MLQSRNCLNLIFYMRSSKMNSFQHKHIFIVNKNMANSFMVYVYTMKNTLF